jgi:phosphohistidine phosphatase SixA
MILHIVRHPVSKPEDNTVDDAERQVTKNGAKKFINVLDRYKKADEMDPDVIFCGPETRNVQSADLARGFFNLEATDVVQEENLGMDGDPQKALDSITQWVKDQGGNPDKLEVMAIGSNPALAGLFQLVHGLGTKAGQSGEAKLKKGSVAKIKIFGVTGDNPTSQLRSYLPPGLAE